MIVHSCNEAAADDESRGIGAIPRVVGGSDVEELDGEQSERQSDSTSHWRYSSARFVVIVRFRRICNQSLYSG